MADLVIHALGVAGGSLAICPLPGRAGDYSGDLSFVRDWKPSIVISAVSRAELVDASADTFPTDILQSGARWVHLPIRDFGLPDQAVLDAWDEVFADVISVLKGQGRVLIHCKGGCGRSGMLALRIMVASGEDAVEALLRLRKVRPCAVETDAQLRWAVTGKLI